MHQIRTTLLGLLVLVVGSLALHAAPRFWEAATQAEFLRGDIENLSLDEHGRLTLGPEVRRLHDAATPFVWTMVPGPEESVWLGTGNDGRVLRVDRSGNGQVFFDSDEMEVHALAPGTDGSVYVGTSPDGRVYRVDAKGQATTFFDPEDKYIWALAVDRSGAVFVATGDKGMVYRVSPDGKGAPHFSTKATHALTLSFDTNGQLLVGTGTPGRVFRVDPSGRGFLLLDTPFQEVKALRSDAKGVLYVAAQSARPTQNGDTPSAFGTPVELPSPTPVPSVSTEVTTIAVIDVPVSAQPAGAPPARDARSTTGAIYRVLPDGLWDELWESREDSPYDLAVEPDGSLLVTTGGRGKIIRLTGDPMRPTLLTRVTAQQVTAIHRSATQTLVATANPGQLLALANARADTGSYESDVKDARMVATWGAVAWRSVVPEGTRVELRTRSGNTRTPDDAWSDWSPPYPDPNGSQIVSPKARYLQWRAVLSGKGTSSPVLTAVRAAYLQRNVRPAVDSVTVHPPGVVFQKPFSTGEAEIAGFGDEPLERRMTSRVAGQGAPSAPALGRSTYQKGLQTFVWKADDENGDELTYDVMYRREGDTTWKLLKGELTDSILVWDTSSVPNGAYVMKVVASDSRSNPSETALRGERESGSFDVDNTPPAVMVEGVKRDGTGFIVSFDVRDVDSAVSRVEFSLDAQRWQLTFPQDGILDSRQERFSLRLDGTTAGRVLVIRATDAMHNLGSGEVVIR